MLTKAMVKSKIQIECEHCGAVSTVTLHDLTCQNPSCGYQFRPHDDLLTNLFGRTVQVLDRSLATSAFGMAPRVTAAVLPVEQMAATVIDESKWNWRYDRANQLWLAPDYDKLKTTDALLIIKKASQGLWDDPTWDLGMGTILSKNIGLGGYHYADVYFDTVQSARKLAGQAQTLPSEAIWGTSTLPQWWLDCENNKGNGTVAFTPSQMASYIYAFVQEFQNITGYPMGIYTRSVWWDRYVARNTWAYQLALWVARYNAYISEPGEPKDWGNYNQKPVLWQWSADGNGQGFQYGYQSNSVDLNRSPLLTDQQVLDIVYYGDGTPPIVGLPLELLITDPATGATGTYRKV